MNKTDLGTYITDFVMQNQEKYYRVAYQYVRNREDALDVVHDAIKKAYSNMNSLKNPEYIRTWFYRIVVNTALDLLRKQKKNIVIDDEILSNLDTGMMDKYEDVDLNNSLNALPEQYRSVIILRYFEDFKLGEIAEILNENLSTVKRRLYKALQILRIDMIEEDY
ncbi:sigma-70 family RNA polymerase sigma factor [Lysinibacillus sp. JNUCC 51]|uniref:sigma-70 family RNA polymerase sigma factor n=1 Tax=Lysinibacillus sp. JNUCC-51 TaxID=2792479 RepID=UPI001934C786|nr:sigma-70 family RNA polymerase sigma factor [Lysinibacillus sp. JNUCC-51]